MSSGEAGGLEDAIMRRDEVLKGIRGRRRLQEEIRGKRRVEFLRNLWWKFAKFENNPKWVKPKGRDSKVRLRLKGYPPMVEVGYRTPGKIRGLHPSGLKPVVVHSPEELEALDPGVHIVYIASTVGARKRREILEKAVSKGLRLANGVA